MEKSKFKKMTDLEFTKLSEIIQSTLIFNIKMLQHELNYFNLWKSMFGMPDKAIQFCKNKQQHKEKWDQNQLKRLIYQVNNENFYDQQRIKSTVEKINVFSRDMLKMIRHLYCKQQQKQQEKSHQKQKKLNTSKNKKIIQLEQKKFIKIKSYNLNQLCSKILNLKQKPKYLQIKCNPIQQQIRLKNSSYYIQKFLKQYVGMYNHYNAAVQNQLNYAVSNLSDKISVIFFEKVQGVYQNFIKEYNLNQLILFYIGTLGISHEHIKLESLLSQSLSKLPELKQISIVAYDIKSLQKKYLIIRQGFQNLGSKIKASKDYNWANNIDW